LYKNVRKQTDALIDALSDVSNGRRESSKLRMRFRPTIN
jgi:hypothetical protein